MGRAKKRNQLRRLMGFARAQPILLNVPAISPSLPRPLEVPQIRRLLALLGGHEQAIRTHHIVFLANANMRVALRAVPRNPDRARAEIANVFLGYRPGTGQRVVEYGD